MSNARGAAPSLTEGPVAKSLVLFLLPILGTNVLQSLNGSVNAMWVGRYLGGAALTAASNANTVLFFLIGLVFGIAMAASILVAQSMGARDLEAAKRVVGTSVSFFLVVSTVVSVAGFFAAPQLLVWMRTPAEALPYAIPYLRIIFLAMPAIFANAFVTMMLRGAGDARTPLMFSALAVGLDIALNPLFIFGWGPLPAMGTAGAATATLIASTTGFAAMVVFLYRRKHFLLLKRDELSYLRIDRAILASLIKKGFPMGLQMIVMSGSAIVMISLVNGFGTATTAAFGAGLQLWNYIQMPAMAIGMASSAMAAQNVGAQRWDRVSRVAIVGVALNLAMTGTLASITVVFGRTAVGLFSTDPITVAIGVHLNAIVIWSFCLFGVSMVLSGVVRATGAVVPPLAILFLALWGVRIPFAVVLSKAFGVEAIWWSFPLASLLSMVLSIAYYRFGGWRAARMI